ncbi:RING/U-box superfamily protein with ARM repeat domain isoform 1 [Tripterygium wilfordii]|uniref:RING-type E3 ubiquitin transferase n=1 Tax=Tripterygium wilfordii TaxID=458696 RepID=A0A7J7CVW9_TRIWF|nr:U-box domain-containing protein 4-like [Tripterygium wilfordii]XP_038720540.1 U-box domain-containing protein 4-like [Tripterygium wilfordii]XP_038720543.1 U-box domain-containing protein 4-like [Tripterygium wilfordii]XP_038720544.1 U-box domain-containing protein 4-like [Tripterygium wilfordii]XP_038720545.1 U-box domain-containing protein 4-like [Tripterygium wilfordii]KAF5738240.1 RING/U-box superfamily protein with ARM repeat domain isoform 1 [Tripterygium wilfordii]
MEISLLKSPLNSISTFSHLSSFDNIKSDPMQRCYKKAEEILNLLRPILDAIVDSEIASDDMLNKAFERLGQFVDELTELFRNWQSLSSKIYFVLQINTLLVKIQTSGQDILQLLKVSHRSLPDELSSSSLEHCIQRIKHMGYDRVALTIKEALRDQVEGVGPSSEVLVKIAENLGLSSNQETLIEAVALEKLKENAEQIEKTSEVEIIDQMIGLVTRMHDRLVTIKQSQSCSPVPIPADFCCPLSLELMTDPVIVASGQTYERAFIKNWIDLGLTVCPKTRQTVARTNLIPNYTVKALIATWCESNNVKLPDPLKSMSLTQPTPLLTHAESGPPEDLQIYPNSKDNWTLSPEPIQSGSRCKSLISSAGTYGEGASPLHPRSTSEGSLSSVTGNGLGLDIDRLSLKSSEDKATDSEARSTDSVGEKSVSPVRKDSFNIGGPCEPSQSHSRTLSASSMLSSTNINERMSVDANGTSDVSDHRTSYSSDASGVVKAEPQVDGAWNTPQRETEVPLRLVETRSRSQKIWHRPSERFVPRIVSSPAIETGLDLSGLESHVRKLVEDLRSTSVDAQREATADLRQLAKQNTDNRIVITSCGAISLLVNLLYSADSEIQENAVTTLLNLSINDNNKTAIANAEAIEPLIHVLHTGSPTAKENSAATLFSLSVIEENKIRIGRSGAIEPLVDLLGNGTPRGKKDAATALFNLSIFHENKVPIVQAGAVKHLVELLDPAAGMIDKAVAVLANLATIPEGKTAIGQERGIPFIVEVIELGSARGKENAAAALLHLCTSSVRFTNIVLQEGAVPPLVVLSQSGTARAKEKAQQLLTHFKEHRHGNAGRN